MDMALEAFSRSGVLKAAHDAGITLSAEEARAIAASEGTCLAACGRVSFGESAAIRLVRMFGDSPFLAGVTIGSTLMELVEAFYSLREDFPATITDEEILEALRDTFDGEAAGDVGLALPRTRNSLAESQTNTAYEITDDDGKVYRWNPEEWHDDVMADGWYGERWEDIDE